MSFSPVSMLCGFLPVLMYSAIASTPSAAISSGYCCEVAPMMPSLTHLTSLKQPPSTATIDDALVLARRLQRRIAAVGRRLVDRIDDVDLVGLLQDVLHRLAAALGRALRDVGADDLRAVALRVVLGILDRDAEAGEEAVVALVVDRRLVGGEVEGGDLGGLRLVAERRLRPLADQLARLEVVGADIGVGGVGRIERQCRG